MLVGYAGASTPDQSFILQNDALREAGCERLYDGRPISLRAARAARRGYMSAGKERRKLKAATRYFAARAKQAGFWTCFLGILIVLLVVLLLAAAIVEWAFLFWLLGLSDKSEVLKYLGIGIAGLLLMLQAVIANRRAKAMQQAAEAQVAANKHTEGGQRQERLKKRD